MYRLQRLHRRLLPDDPRVGWTPYLWLAYLIFFFFRYAFVAPGPAESAAVAVTLAVFLGLYFNGYWKRGRALLPNIAGLVLLGVLWAPYNPGAGVFFIYAASFAAWIGPPRRAAIAVGVVVLFAVVCGWFLQRHPAFWFPPLLFGSLAGVINIYYAEQGRKDAALRLSQDETRQLAQVAERERISRDLHDLLGHTLSVITLKSELAARLVERDPERADAEIRDVERISRAALAEVREAVNGMRTRGLVAEIEHARVALKSAGVRLSVEGRPPALASAKEAILAMVVREAVTNVIRHAQAGNCTIAILADDDGDTLVEVRDDGRGGAPVLGTGLDGMRKRLTAAGGRLEVGDELGLRLRAWLPS